MAGDGGSWQKDMEQKLGGGIEPAAAAPALPAAFRKRASDGSASLPAVFKKPKLDAMQSMMAHGPSPMQSMTQSQPDAMQSMMQCMAQQSQPDAMQSMMQGMAQPSQPDAMQSMMQGMAQQSQPNPMQAMMQNMMGANPQMMQMMQMMQMQKAMAAAPAQNANGPNDAMQSMMQNMFQMGQMHMLQQAMQKQQKKKGAAAMQQAASMQQALPSVMQQAAAMQQALPAAGAMGTTMDMSSWAQIPDPQDAAAPSDMSMESQQAYAAQAGFAATQQAIYDQQMMFFHQAKLHRSETEKSARGGLSRFKDDYRAYLLCKNNSRGYCENGQRCEFAHCYEELHPASPEMPKDEAIVQSALDTLKQPPKEENEAPKIQLRKKRDLCRKFMDSGHCSRGGACPNAHGEAEIGKTAFVLYDKVKMEICKAWRDGKCAYGGSCIYAHGEQEIGQKRREWDAPPIKKRRGHQTIEDWRYEILRDPDAPSF